MHVKTKKTSPFWDLVRHAQSLGIEVIYDHHAASVLNVYLSGTNRRIRLYKITIQKTNLTRQFHELLHELGHYLIMVNKIAYKRKYPACAIACEYHDQTKYKRRVDYKVQSMLEEAEAWDLGQRVAEDLGIPLNLIAYNKLKTKCLAQYMLYYSGGVKQSR